MTEPLTPAGCDLRDFPHTPLFRSRLFGSSFHARATDSEWRAGVTLWLKSWDQVPAGSLPDDDIELCRLAELARDVKTWKKVKAGALRGWALCDDGRLYHPVVAEGINNAIEHKTKQRLKTAKARITALEKHLKEATTDADRARITDEIRKIQQTVSQSLSQTLSQGPSEGEGRGKEKGEGLDSSVPDGTGGEPPAPAPKPPKVKTQAEEEKSTLWAALKIAMVEQRTCPDHKEAGVLLGGLAKKYGNDVFLEAMRQTVANSPGDTHTYLIALCETAAGKRPGLGAQTFAERDAEVARSAVSAWSGGRLGQQQGQKFPDVIDMEETNGSLT